MTLGISDGVGGADGAGIPESGHADGGRSRKAAGNKAGNKPGSKPGKKAAPADPLQRAVGDNFGEPQP